MTCLRNERERRLEPGGEEKRRKREERRKGLRREERKRRGTQERKLKCERMKRTTELTRRFVKSFLEECHVT